MADGDGLENHCGGNVTVGSNPTPSAQPGKAMPDLALYAALLGRHLISGRSQTLPNAAVCRCSGDIRGMDLGAFPQVGVRKKEGPAERSKLPALW